MSAPLTPFSDFAGRIGRTREESVPAWTPRRPAPAGSPNIVIVYMDDMGFSDPGCFGGEIETPHIDALAARGLRFNHYTTHPICSPARAALLTGMNAHAVGTGWLANNNPGYPGYSGEIPLDARDPRRDTPRGRLRDDHGRQVAQHADPRLACPPARSTAGRPAAASTPSMASWRARRTSSSPRSS